MITLASDFGSPYPAAMKGVILQRTDARLVDVSHSLPRQDPRAAAFWLRSVLPYFPSAIHLVVVDPGVGTDRRVLAIRAGSHALVGADNGALLPPARALAADGELEVFALDPARVARAESSTFHGRDVFAPLAGAVHEVGVDGLERLDRLEPIDDPVDLRLPVPDESDGTLEATILVVDDFGNAITNVPGDRINELLGYEVLVDGRPVPFEPSYGHVEPGEALVTVGSHGYVELAVNRGRGDEAFAVSPDETVELEFDVR